MVSIGKQLEFLQSYVYLERLRSDETLKVDFEVKGKNLDLKVAPLLYLAFIENAFKHGSKNKKADPYIHILFNLEHGDRVIFTIENKVEKYPEQKPSGGFGLSNVKKRLELLYPGRHELKIEESATQYRVELTILAG
jgi:LytS/YehU family sensor histidine kinase